MVHWQEAEERISNLERYNAAMHWRMDDLECRLSEAEGRNQMSNDKQIDEIIELLKDIQEQTKRMANAMEAPLVPGSIREMVTDEELDEIIAGVFKDMKGGASG